MPAAASAPTNPICRSLAARCTSGPEIMPISRCPSSMKWRAISAQASRSRDTILLCWKSSATEFTAATGVPCASSACASSTFSDTGAMTIRPSTAGAPHETHHVVDEAGRLVIHGMHQQLITELGALAEDAALHVVGDLRVRIVVHEAQHEGAIARERARAQARHEVEIADDLLHSRAGVGVHFRRLVEHARGGAYGDAGRMGHVVDGDRRADPPVPRCP